MTKKLLILMGLLPVGIPSFAQSVDTAWVRRYNGPGNYSDYASAIAVDGSGNVLVTGYSVGSETAYDYATIKYDADGNELWVKRYNGPGDFSDVAYAIAVDGSGNVYVTGRSWGSGTFSDYATNKVFSVAVFAWRSKWRWRDNYLRRSIFDQLCSQRRSSS